MGLADTAGAEFSNRAVVVRKTALRPVPGLRGCVCVRVCALPVRAMARRSAPARRRAAAPGAVHSPPFSFFFLFSSIFFFKSVKCPRKARWWPAATGCAACAMARRRYGNTAALRCAARRPHPGRPSLGLHIPMLPFLGPGC